MSSANLGSTRSAFLENQRTKLELTWESVRLKFASGNTFENSNIVAGEVILVLHYLVALKMHRDESESGRRKSERQSGGGSDSRVASASVARRSSCGSG